MEFLDRLGAYWNALPRHWVLAAALGAGVCVVLYLIRRGSASERSAQRSGPTPPGLDRTRELQKTIARLEGENAALSTFFSYLPDFTKQLISREINSRMDKRSIAPLLQKVIDALLAPAQIMILLLDEGSGMLRLVQQKGAEEPLARGMQVAMGSGRIGYVAAHKITMATDDFIREMRQTGQSLDAGAQFGCNTELCAPMVYDEQVIGVISVGGITKHNKHEKTMLTLLADLGSIALYNTALFSKTQEMANCDGLTRLYNKRFFMERLADEIRQARTGHSPVSVFIFDLDNFKHYNDTHGHQAGDEVLRITGRILRDAVRPGDLPARYGGEEFIVIWAKTSKNDGLAIAERIRKKVAEHPYPHRETQPLGMVSLSGGVATCPDDGLTGADLIKAADAALYEAKRAGRNLVFGSKPTYFSDEVDGSASGAKAG
jgi:diguanylate cyclase (GGDEF)-like protein